MRNITALIMLTTVLSLTDQALSDEPETVKVMLPPGIEYNPDQKVAYDECISIVNTKRLADGEPPIEYVSMEKKIDQQKARESKRSLLSGLGSLGADLVSATTGVPLGPVVGLGGSVGRAEEMEEHLAGTAIQQCVAYKMHEAAMQRGAQMHREVLEETRAEEALPVTPSQPETPKPD